MSLSYMAPGEQKSDESSPHVRIIASTLKNSKSQKALPDRYVWDDDYRNATRMETESLKEDDCLKLPIIDLSRISAANDLERKKVAKQVGSAAENWGFFQVINHGVPEAVIAEMVANGEEFFRSWPLEVKERGIETKKHIYYHGYGGRFQHLHARVPWLEYLGECYHPDNGVEALVNKIWPGQRNLRMCRAVDEFCKTLVQLGRQILELLAESLDLPSDFFSREFTDSKRYQAHWRFNKYPVCPEPMKALGLGPHTDPCGITIVKQDNVGGFQLRKGDHWFDVQPLEGSLLVNIGDCLQAWSNGRFSSVLHRALVNDKAERLSIVFPFSPPADFEVTVPPSLIDEAHP